MRNPRQQLAGLVLALLLQACSGGPTASLTASSNTVILPSRTTGSNSSASVTIVNSGDYGASAITVAALSSPFSFLGGTYPGTGGTCGATVESGARCTLIFAFDAPVNSVKTHTSSISLQYYDGSQTKTLTVGLKATSTAPSFTSGTAFSGGAGNAYDLAMTKDGTGKVFACGDFTTYRGTAAVHIARINTDSSLDTSFVVGAGFDAQVISILPLSDGSGVYAAGSFTTYQGTAAHGLVKLKNDGSIDTSFAVGVGFATGNEAPYKLAYATDGKILAGGSFTTYQGVSVSAPFVKISTNGALDTGFNSGAVVFTIDLLPIANGTIYQTGYLSGTIVRLLSDGTTDPSFVLAGSGFSSGFPVIYSVAEVGDGSGRVYVGGNVTGYNGTTLGNIARLNSDGSLDTSLVTGTGFNTIVKKILLAPDGSGDIFAGGFFATYNTITTNGLVRLHSSGTRVTSFTSTVSPSAMVLATDGSSHLYATEGPSLWRLSGTSGDME